MSMNKVFLMGRITRDIEKKATPSGVSVVNFTLAVEDDYKPKDGTDRHVDFVDCNAWAGTADFISTYMGKGRNVVVVGQLKSDKYTDKDGNKRTSWKVKVDNIYFADSKKDGSASVGQAPADAFDNDDDGSLPF